MPLLYRDDDPDGAFVEGLYGAQWASLLRESRALVDDARTLAAIGLLRVSWRVANAAARFSKGARS